jgi:hypothetical protein
MEFLNCVEPTGVDIPARVVDYDLGVAARAGGTLAAGGRS